VLIVQTMLIQSWKKMFTDESIAMQELKEHQYESTCKLFPTQIKGKYEANVSCWALEEITYNDDCVEKDSLTIQDVYDNALEFTLLDVSEYPKSFEYKW